MLNTRIDKINASIRERSDDYHAGYKDALRHLGANLQKETKMSETKKIWALTDGGESDYYVIGVFSTYENARIAAEHCKLTPEDIEEWVLDLGVENINAGRTLYRICMLRDGTVTSCFSARNYIEAREPFVTFSTGIGNKRNYYLYGDVWAHNATEAEAIADTYRQRFIAEGKWPLPDSWYDIDPQTGELKPV